MEIILVLVIIYIFINTVLILHEIERLFKENNKDHRYIKSRQAKEKTRTKKLIKIVDKI